MISERLRRVASDVAAAAFEAPSGSRRAMRSLLAALVLAGAVFIVGAGFAHLGPWFLVATGWAFIAVMIWRYRDRIDVRRLGAALRDERSREGDAERPAITPRPGPLA